MMPSTDPAGGNRHELLDQVFAAIERRDHEFIEAWFERHAHPEIEFNSVLTSVVEGRVYRGKRGMSAWASDLIDTLNITYGGREFRDVGEDIVVVLVRPTLEGRGSGLEAVFEVGFVVEYEGDLVRRGASHASHADALAAAEAILA